MKKTLLLLALAVPLSGCSLSSVPAYLPHKPNFIDSKAYARVDFPPPPAPGSQEATGDLYGVIEWQSRRTPEQCKQAGVTADAGYDYFWGENHPFGGKIPEAQLDFFGRIYEDLEVAVSVMKERYKRKRPFKLSGEVKPCIKLHKGYSYPSGHATFSRVYALVFADIMPERRAEFLAAADRIALDRVIGGVHFPSDIEAGRKFGEMVHAELLKNPVYVREIREARTAVAAAR